MFSLLVATVLVTGWDQTMADAAAVEVWSSLLLGCCLLLLLLFVSYWKWVRSSFVQFVNALPGPPIWPVLGNFIDICNIDHDGDLDCFYCSLSLIDIDLQQ